MTQWYEDLFANYAEQYDKEPFTQGTMGEVDFIESERAFSAEDYEMLVIAQK